MKIKANHIIILLIVITVAALGSLFTSLGMPWYDSNIIKPDITPPAWVFPVMWNTIFILTAISAIIIWNKGTAEKKFLWFKWPKKPTAHFWWIVTLLLINAILNVMWSYLFFYKQMILASLWEMIVLEFTTLLIMVLSWKISRIASLLFLPYLIWVGIATYLTYLIFILN
jgi:tryptophan-rich sensory protein